MVYERGERQARRTKKALVQAFSQLIQEKNYSDITVNDITNHADIGRSTFYRYFKSKADLLIEMHKRIFDKVLFTHSSASDWLSDKPSSELIQFLEKFQKPTPGQFSLTYVLGSDIDYVTRQITCLLKKKTEESLHRNFSEKSSTIPFAILAQAVSGIYNQVLLSWFSKKQNMDAEDIATCLQRMSRSVIREGYR